MRVIVAGTGRLGASVLDPVLQSDHIVAGLMLNGQRTRGVLARRSAVSPLLGADDPAIQLARREGIPLCWLDEMTPAALAPITALEPDLLITCGFGIILKPALLELPSLGCLNVHSSLLPKHRGPMPFNWVVLQGDSETGVTFHETTVGIDEGPILAQRRIPLGPNDTTLSVYRRCCDQVRREIVGVLDTIAREGLNGTPQDPSAATYDPPLKRDDLRIDWTQGAADIERLIRAGSPLMPAWFTSGKTEVQVDRARALANDHKEAAPGEVVDVGESVRVATGHGQLEIVRAAALRPIYWPWPSAFNRPRNGDVLR